VRAAASAFPPDSPGAAEGLTVSPPPPASESPAAESGGPRVLTRRADFLAANRGLRVSRPGFVLLARPNGGEGRRFGITVTKRIGNAVVRNRMKRRFRALLRDVLPLHGLADTDHVMIGREGGIERDFGRLREELLAALGRAQAGKGDPPRRRKGPPAK
jgi:ribonuclease P protein component